MDSVSAPEGPQAITKSFISLKAVHKACIESGNTCTMSPSSTIDDFAERPAELFKAPLKTMKLAPVAAEISL